MKIELRLPGLSKKKGKNYCTAVLVAAGSSSRMQGTDKILTDISGALSKIPSSTISFSWYGRIGGRQ